MDLNSSNKPKSYYYFVCTNYGSSKDGIGHYTSKIVTELRNAEGLKVNVYAKQTDHLSRLKLFFSFRMSTALLKLNQALKNHSLDENIIVLEYPFVEYNPLFLLVLFWIRIKNKSKSKIVISLHEYFRTKLLRKLFIKLLLPLGDIVLYTKKEDIKTFNHKNIVFKQRIIPANIEPTSRKIFRDVNYINVCFFGILNFETKEINNMLKGWELYFEKHPNTKLQFHFITSIYNAQINKIENITCHFGLNDEKVSSLLHTMHFMVLPLKPKISLNNGSLSVSCIHECVPIGKFDDEFFESNFGLEMRSYTVEAFINIFELIDNMGYEEIKEASLFVYDYGRKNSIANAAKYYLNL